MRPFQDRELVMEEERIYDVKTAISIIKILLRKAKAEERIKSFNTALGLYRKALEIADEWNLENMALKSRNYCRKIENRILTDEFNYLLNSAEIFEFNGEYRDARKNYRRAVKIVSQLSRKGIVKFNHLTVKLYKKIEELDGLLIDKLISSKINRRHDFFPTLLSRGLDLLEVQPTELSIKENVLEFKSGQGIILELHRISFNSWSVKIILIENEKVITMLEKSHLTTNLAKIILINFYHGTELIDIFQTPNKNILDKKFREFINEIKSKLDFLLACEFCGKKSIKIHISNCEYCGINPEINKFLIWK